MIQFRDHLSPDVFRAIQFSLLNDPDRPYSAMGEFGHAPRDELLHRILNVRGQKISRIISAASPFEPSAAAAAWSQLMALVAGRHLFPDANHRTGLLAFNWVTFRTRLGFYGLKPADSATMVEESKAMRD